MAVCGARTKTCRKCKRRYSKDERDLWQCPECGEPRACQQHVVREGERCRMHGGASLHGIANPAFRHGRYSKYLPESLIDRYRAAREDQELLSLRDEVALLDSRLTTLVQQLENGAGPELWQNLKTKYQELTDARAEGRTRDMVPILLELGKAIEKGAESEVIWAAIAPALEMRRRLVESERKRLVEAGQMISSERAMILVTAIVDIVTRHVGDRNTLNAIALDIRDILARSGSLLTPASSDQGIAG